ncbi:hypothetical protein [Halococcus qingdaonensis]|uniref:hypothetical protein n=1 Tax=Halococcus qingdaonensis TaxID=224402 RepID=UPI0021161D3A|nr:hypothetical protein [Halococcus qingdaonensis]
MKLSVGTVLLVMLVVSAGCSTLARNDDESTATPTVIRESETPTETVVNATTVGSGEPSTTAMTATETPDTTTEPTSTPTATRTATPTATDGRSDVQTMKIEAVGNGTSNYTIYGVGDGATTAAGTEKTDSVVANDTATYATGITGERAADTYDIRTESVGRVVNNGTATLELYIDGELRGTYEPNENPSQSATTTDDGGPTHNLTIRAIDDGTSRYVANGVGESAYPAQDTEQTDTIVSTENDGLFPTATGITGDHAKDTYSVRWPYLEEFSNEGNATLQVYIDGELKTTVGPGGVDPMNGP